MLLRDVLRTRWRAVTVSSALLAAHQLAEASVPLLVGVVIDQAVRTGDTGALLRWLAVLVALFAVLAAAWSSGAWVGSRAEFGAAHDLRVRVARRVLHPAGGSAAAGNAGELVSLASSDADRTAQVCRAVALGVAALTVLTGGAVVLLVTSLPLGLVVLVGLPVVLFGSRALSRPLAGRAETEQATLARATGVAADLVGGLRVLTGIGAAPAAAARYRAASRDALAARLAAARFEGGYEAATFAISGVFLVVVAWVGGRLALDGAITVGQLVAGVGLAQFLVGPLERLASVGAMLAQAKGSEGRVGRLLAAPPAVRSGPDRPRGKGRGALRCRGVRHGSLRGLDLDVAAGAHVGIVVCDPSDAEALLAVLARDVDPEGRVELDGTALPTLDLDAVRRAVLVARHDGDLFEGTVGENISAAAEGPIGPAVAAATADEVAAALPAGFDTELTERGRSVSGGQRQRIALARALAADPVVLVVHDPTTAVDAVTEDRIATGLATLRRGHSTLLVTTSPALLARCDRVVLVADGVAAAEGTHASLAAADARYRTAVLT